MAGNKVWICSSEQNRAISESRRLMKKIHELCMKVKLELGEITQKEFTAPASQQNTGDDTFVVAGGAADTVTQVPGTDSELDSDVPNGYWQGSVYWMELGKPFLESQVVEGIFTVKGRGIEFTDEEGNLSTLKYNILTLATTCQNPEPCMAEIFVMQ